MEKAILILALSSGEHVLAETHEHAGAYVLTNALQILSQQDEATGQVRMGLVAYLPFSDPEAGIAVPTNMAIIAFPNEELKTHYCTRFGLIITPAAQKIIV